jgi:hypothetical protein
MRSYTEREDPDFRPLAMTIVLETPEEVQALYAVANYNKAVAKMVETKANWSGDRAPITEAQIASVLYYLWKAMNDAGVHSGAGGKGVAS